MDKIKIGVFGAYRGMTMINALAAHPDALLVAVCDKYEPALENVKKLSKQKNIDIVTYTDFEDFFKHDMDAVVLANYANEHAPYAVRLLKSGRHVMSEVLPCETMAQAVELIEAVEESGKVYAYAENYCYMLHTFEMQMRYERGEIGEVTYAEGEYVHDCASIWPQITYGEKDHWRNRMYSTFYCTHSIGPMMTITGRRPVQVVGFETPVNWDIVDLGKRSGIGGGIEIITLDNGAVAKSVHGNLKREPGSINYEIYGSRGMMESDRIRSGIMVYKEGENLCQGSREVYDPKMQVTESMKDIPGDLGHGGSDFYPTHFFIQKILGKPDGMKYSIDVYTAVDMGICGILAYRSILGGNIPVKVPDFRNRDEREAYRNDTASVNPKVAGDQLLPMSSHLPEGKMEFDIPEETYEYVKKLWLNGENAKKHR